MSGVKTYVGTDGKLHFTDGTGADTALPFSAGFKETFSGGRDLGCSFYSYINQKALNNYIGNYRAFDPSKLTLNTMETMQITNNVITAKIDGTFDYYLNGLLQSSKMYNAGEAITTINYAGNFGWLAILCH